LFSIYNIGENITGGIEVKKGRHGVLVQSIRMILILAAATALLGFSTAPAAAVENGKDALRIEQLESALAPQDAQQTAEDWAQSLAHRNGALRFALLSDSLRTKYEQDYADCNWVIGCSSPWVDSYRVVQYGENGKGGSCYEVNYTLADSTDGEFFASEMITVQKMPIQGSDTFRWCVIDGNNLRAMDFPQK
jgi:hypothetical protein